MVGERKSRESILSAHLDDDDDDVEPSLFMITPCEMPYPSLIFFFKNTHIYTLSYIHHFLKVFTLHLGMLLANNLLKLEIQSYKAIWHVEIG